MFYTGSEFLVIKCFDSGEFLLVEEQIKRGWKSHADDTCDIQGLKKQKSTCASLKMIMGSIYSILKPPRKIELLVHPSFIRPFTFFFNKGGMLKQYRPVLLS